MADFGLSRVVELSPAVGKLSRQLSRKYVRAPAHPFQLCRDDDRGRGGI